jgi:bifunctional DNA-binding transcriptional regulator/antitoxin component of YhaV-PrlF toxin-antitoxin module
MKYISKVQKNGNINIPVAVRQALKLNKDDIVVWSYINELDKVVIWIEKFPEQKTTKGE